MISTTPSDPAFWRPRGLRKPPRELPERPHLPQDSPSGPKGDPKTAHEGPKRAPRRPQRAPRRPKRAPKGALESPRRVPRGSQEGPQIVQAPQDGPIQPRGCPKGPSDRAWEGKKQCFSLVFLKFFCARASAHACTLLLTNARRSRACPRQHCISCNQSLDQGSGHSH